jgi:hypothetical protein
VRNEKRAKGKGIDIDKRKDNQGEECKQQTFLFVLRRSFLETQKAGLKSRLCPYHICRIFLSLSIAFPRLINHVDHITFTILDCIAIMSNPF